MESNFSFLIENAPQLLSGVMMTVAFTIGAMLLGGVASIVLVYLRIWGSVTIRTAIAIYVEVIRNTPFIIQIFFIYFSLPSIGIRMSANTAALLALTINVTSYTIEILRAGLISVPKGQIEAGYSLGLTRFQVVKDVVLAPALRGVYPALSSQSILLMLSTSVVSVISAHDLMSAANEIGSRTFRQFDIYIITAFIFLILTAIMHFSLSVLRKFIFRYPENIR